MTADRCFMRRNDKVVSRGLLLQKPSPETRCVVVTAPTPSVVAVSSNAAVISREEKRAGCDRAEMKARSEARSQL